MGALASLLAIWAGMSAPNAVPPADAVEPPATEPPPAPESAESPPPSSPESSADAASPEPATPRPPPHPEAGSPGASPEAGLIPEPKVGPPVLPDTAHSVQTEPATTDAAGGTEPLVDPWTNLRASSPRASAARPRSDAPTDLRDPFAGPPRPAVTVLPPGVVVVAQLDLQDPFRHGRGVAPAPPVVRGSGLDLQDPFGHGEVQFRRCVPRRVVGGVPLQRPTGVQPRRRHCAGDPGPLRDPFARPPARTREPPPVTSPERSV